MDHRDWGDTARGFATHLLTTGRSPGTVRTYTSDIHILWDWCTEREIHPFDCPPTALKEWFALRVQDVSSSRAVGTIAALRAFYAWGQGDGICGSDPSKVLKAKRGKAVPTKPLAKDDFKALLGVCSSERDRTMLMLMAHTGLRITEVATLTPESFDFQRRLITVRGKGDKVAYVAAPDDIFTMVRSLMGFFPAEGEGIWRSEQANRPMKAHQLRKRMYGLAERAGVEVHPHRLRAMFAVEHYKVYRDIERLRRAMRHSDVLTTQGYIAHLEDEPVYEMVRRLSLTG